MDVNRLLQSVYQDIALTGSIGLPLVDLWKKLENVIDLTGREFIWQQLAQNESLEFYKTEIPISDPFGNVPKVLYNNEKTLAILENTASVSAAVSAASLKMDASWKNVTSSVKNEIVTGTLSCAEADKRFGKLLRVVKKHPEVSQMNGVWDPLLPLPAKCSVLINFLSRQGTEGALSCGSQSPLNAAVGVKSTTIFHLKKITSLYGLVRWRRILVKKARLSRHTNSGTCAVLSRFVSRTFLLPDRMITLGKQLADFIIKEDPIGRTVEVHKCIAGLTWTGKRFRAVVSAFSDYFAYGFKKSSELASSDALSAIGEDSNESKLCVDDSGYRMYKTVTLHRSVGLSLNASISLSKSSVCDDDEFQETDETRSVIYDDTADSVEDGDDGVLGQLCIVRSPLRSVWEKIASTGDSGITMQELRTAPNLGVLVSLLRRYIRLLINAGCIKWATDQVGRQHVKRYYATKKGEILLPAEPESKKPANSFPVSEDSSSAHRSKFASSLVSSARKQTIESCLSDRRALLQSELVAKLRTVDSKVQGSVDRRTVQRLCAELAHEKRIGLVTKPLKAQGGGTLTVYTAYGVDSDDEAVKGAVARRDRCIKPVAVPVSDESELACGPLRIRMVNNGRVALQLPKMQRVELLHSFLWYIIHGEGKTEQLTGHLAACAQNIKCVNTEDMPHGWVRLSAALDAMPLYLLAYICPVALAILSPNAITAAINSGLTFSQLAPDLRASALHTWGSFSLAGEVREQVLILNNLCLVTFIERRSHSTSHLRSCIYIHQATPVSPLPLARDEPPAIQTAFATFHDVVTFWSDLRNESILSPGSRVGASVPKSNEQPQEKTKKSRLAQLCKLSLHVPSFEDVPLVRPVPLGNGLGPAGTDSRARFNVSAFWKSCKWAVVPRLDEESQKGLSSRRRTKLMALAGNFRRRKAVSAKRPRLQSVGGDEGPLHFGRGTKSKSANSTTRKMIESDEFVAVVPKRQKTENTKKKATTTISGATQRRRRIIRQNIITHSDNATDGSEEANKMYKTLSNLIDAMNAHEEYYLSMMADPTSSGESLEPPTPIADRDIAMLAEIVFRACVIISTPPDKMASQVIAPFQDTRRLVVFPTLDVSYRGWVSHAVDLLTSLYNNYKPATLIFQVLIAAVDVLINDESCLSSACHPESISAMKKFWDIVYSSFKNENFLRTIFSLVHFWRNPKRELPLTSSNLLVKKLASGSGRLQIVGDLWGPTGCDEWARVGIFVPLQFNHQGNLVEEENRVRGTVLEQTMCAFLICTRLSQPLVLTAAEASNEVPTSFADIPQPADANRSAVYRQLVASDCSTIQRALAKLMSAKITKRDFVDSVLYNKSKPFSPENESADAHIGDYSLTSAIRFQIANSSYMNASQFLSRVGSFMLNLSQWSSGTTELHLPFTFDLRTSDQSSPAYRVFLSPIGVCCLVGALADRQKQFSLNMDVVPIEKLVSYPKTSATTNSTSSPGTSKLNEIAVWPLILQIQRQQLPSYSEIGKWKPSPSSLKYPAKLDIVDSSSSDGANPGDVVLADIIMERSSTCSLPLADLIVMYRSIQSFGTSGCTYRELFRTTGNATLSHLVSIELVMRVGYSEERIVTTTLAYATWLMTSPPMYPWPWSNADGSINYTSLRTLVTTVAFTILDSPGIGDDMLGRKMGPAVSTVSLKKLIEMLITAGVIETSVFQLESLTTEVNLFDVPPVVSLLSEKDERSSSLESTTVYWIKTDGMMKLGTFITSF